MEKIRVLVVDDHTIVRDGICALLALTEDIQVIGEASNGNEALEKAAETTPDIVLMDISMPGMDGLETTRRLHNQFPSVKVLALTQHDDKEYVLPMIEAGACGFLSKTSASSDLGFGIRSVYRGDSYLSPSVARHLVRARQVGYGECPEIDLYTTLTNREKEVLRLTAEGYTIREIADNLIISPKTVEGHKTRLMTKLDIHSSTDLVKYAVRKGIVHI